MQSLFTEQMMSLSLATNAIKCSGDERLHFPITTKWPNNDAQTRQRMKKSSKLEGITAFCAVSGDKLFTHLIKLFHY